MKNEIKLTKEERIEIQKQIDQKRLELKELKDKLTENIHFQNEKLKEFENKYFLLNTPPYNNLYIQTFETFEIDNCLFLEYESYETKHVKYHINSKKPDLWTLSTIEKYYIPANKNFLINAEEGTREQYINVFCEYLDKIKLTDPREKSDDNIKVMSIDEFHQMGILQELNRQFLHPLGLALEIKIDSLGNKSLGKIWDYRSDPEGMHFGLALETEEGRLETFRRNAQNVKELKEQHASKRQTPNFDSNLIETIPTKIK